MSSNGEKIIRVLAVALSARGFGFAVMEGPNRLVAWGNKVIINDKNAKCLAKLERIIDRYRPGLLVLQDVEGKGSRRATRIKTLNRQIIQMAKRLRLRVKLISNIQVKRAFFTDGTGTKYDMAKILAERYPIELGLLLPSKRRPYESEDARMDIFEAVELALSIHQPYHQLK